MRAGHLESRAKAAARRITTPAMRARLRRVYERFRPAARLDTGSLVREQNALTDFNFLLHELRGAHLSRVSTPGTFLSAGCAGRWYFDWVDERVGAMERHIGLEAFSPEPADLPDHVTWIANDTADMHDVESESVDVVFSGQNVEHLWPDQVVGFLLEANRVLVDGGSIVVDSPNQIVTELLGWSHPEHTIELKASEAEQLLEAAGFRVESTEGLWLCRADGEVLPLFPPETDLARRLERIVDRTALAASRPDDSFVWWCVATKVGPAGVARLTQQMARLFETHWPARCSRFLAHRPVDEHDGTRVARARAGESGLVATSPAFPLRAGVWSAQLDVLVTDAAAGGQAAVVDIIVGADVEHPLVRIDVPGTAGTHRLELEVKVDTTTFGVQVRVTSTGRAAVAVPFSLRMEQLQA